MAWLHDHLLRSVAAQDALDWSDLGSLRCVCQAWQRALDQGDLDENKCTAAIVAVRRERQRRFDALPAYCRRVYDGLFRIDDYDPPCGACGRPSLDCYPDASLCAAAPRMGCAVGPRVCSSCAETTLLLDALSLVWRAEGAVFDFVGRDAHIEEDEFAPSFYLGTVPVALADLRRAGIRVGAAARRSSITVAATQPWALGARHHNPNLVYGNSRPIEVLRCTM
jgi:hypothetical protein